MHLYSTDRYVFKQLLDYSYKFTIFTLFWHLFNMHVISTTPCLYCTMACFHVISISLISGVDHPCALYFLCRLSLCTLLLCCMTHYDITMGHNIDRYAPLWIAIGNDISRDIHCDVIMDNNVAMCTYHGIIIDNVAMNLLCYVLLHQIMILLFHQ